MRKLIGLITFVLITVSSPTFSQSDEDLEFMKDTADTDKGITEYDKYNPVLGGKEIRRCPELPCNDIIKDLYPSGALKHKALYVNGQIKNTSKNYYENGQLEREFKIFDEKKSQLEVYFPNGKLRSRVYYVGKNALKWEDFYSNGNPEFYEEYDKSMEYHIALKFFYFSGKPQSSMVLQDKKKRIYEYREYYPNGQLKTEGQKIHNAAMNDYQKFGKWLSYDRSGKVLNEENFVRGNVAGSGDPMLDFED